MVSRGNAFPPLETLAPLVREAQAGTPGALDRLLQLIRPSLVAYFTRHHFADEAEDLTQNTLLRVARAVTRIMPSQADRYIMTVARRERWRAFRQQRASVAEPLDAAATVPAPDDLVAEVEYLDIQRAVHVACLVVLDGTLRDTMLAYLQGADVDAIAARSGVKPGAVRTRLHRARVLLRRALAPYLRHGSAHAQLIEPAEGRSDQRARRRVSDNQGDSDMSTGHQRQPNLQHAAFFRTLARLTEHDRAWASTVAGLVTLRLVDRWAEGGQVGVPADEAEVRSVQALIGAVAPGVVDKSVLHALIDALTTPRGRSKRSDVAQRLTAYARALQFEAQWDLAADVYRTLVAYVPVGDEAGGVATAYVQLGACLRRLGELDEALSAYAAAAYIAAEHGDAVNGVMATIGEANIALHRGNLPQAEALFDRAIGEAEATPSADVLSLALHGRAGVAGQRGQLDTSVIHGYRALRLCVDQTRRDRILADVATSLGAMGQRQAARDAHLFLAATAQEQELRWIATINLLEIATLDASEIHFERYRRELADAALPPALSAYYHLYVGEGYWRFGRYEDAEAALSRAADVAEEFQVNEVLVKAEALRQELRRVTPAASVTLAVSSPEISEVIRAISEIRTMAGVSED